MSSDAGFDCWCVVLRSIVTLLGPFETDEKPRNLQSGLSKSAQNVGAGFCVAQKPPTRNVQPASPSSRPSDDVSLARPRASLSVTFTSVPPPVAASVVDEEDGSL